MSGNSADSAPKATLIGHSRDGQPSEGHLRRVRCAVGQGDQTRWAFRTFWSRTARDNEWWTTYLATARHPHTDGSGIGGLPQDLVTGSAAGQPGPSPRLTPHHPAWPSSQRRDRNRGQLRPLVTSVHSPPTGLSSACRKSSPFGHTIPIRSAQAARVNHAAVAATPHFFAFRTQTLGIM